MEKKHLILLFIISLLTRMTIMAASFNLPSTNAIGYSSTSISDKQHNPKTIVKTVGTATLTLSADDVVAGQEFILNVDLNNPDDAICGVQADIYLPEGLEFVRDEYDDPVFEGGRATKITTTGSIQTNGALRILCYSAKNYTYTGTEGAVVTIAVKAAETFTAGNITLNKIVLSSYNDKKMAQIKPADFVLYVDTNGTNQTQEHSISIVPTSLTMNVGESHTLQAQTLPDGAIIPVIWKSSNSTIASVNSNGMVTAIMPGTATITATTTGGNNQSATCVVTVRNTAEGTATLTLSADNVEAGQEFTLNVDLNNPNDAICGVQADIYLPEGLEFVLDEYDEPSAEGGRSSKINTECGLMGDGALRILCYSPKNYTYTGTEGAVVSIDVKAADTFTAGDIALKKIVLSRYSNKKVTQIKPADFVLHIDTNQTQEQSISITPTSLTMNVGESHALQAQILPNGANIPVIWKSSNSKIASVDNFGTVTAIAPGTATITVTTADGSNLSATCEITVNKVGSVTLSMSSTDIYYGESFDLYVAMSNPDNKICGLQFDLHLPDGVVPVLDEYGAPIVTGNRSSQITTDGSIIRNGVLRVLAYSSNNYTYTGTEGEIATIRLKVQDNCTNGIISLTNAILTGLTDNNLYKITADDCEFTINPKQHIAQSITLNKNNIELKIGDIDTLTTTIRPDNTPNKSVLWSSSDQTIVKVNNGIIQAIAPGEAIITATTTDGSNISANCSVTVKEPTATLNVTMPEIFAGEEFELNIEMHNPDDQICGAQFDICLPEGVSVVLDQDGAPIITGHRSSKITTEASILSSSTLRVLTYSAKNYTYSDTEGAIATLHFKAEMKVSPIQFTITQIILSAINNGKLYVIRPESRSITVTPQPRLAQSITLSDSTLEIEEGDSCTLSTHIQPVSTFDKSVSWKSSDETIATVINGAITAISPGTVTVTATTNDGSNLCASCQVTVNKKETAVLSLVPADIYYDEEFNLDINLDNPDDDICGAQLDIYVPEGIAPVVDEYNAPCIIPGSRSSKITTETAILDNGAVRVLCYSAKNYTFAGNEGTIATIRLKVSRECGGGDITMSKAILSATRNQHIRAIHVKDTTFTVNPMPRLAQEIILDRSSIEVAIGESDTLTAQVLPMSTYDPSITWASSDEDVAIVNNGIVTAIKPGKATITATTNDGSNISTSCEVTASYPADTDFSQFDNTLYFNHTQVYRKHANKIVLNLKNTETIVGFQCDLYLPEGITVITDEYGDAELSYGARVNPKASIETAAIADAARILCYSTKNYPIEGNDGAVVSISINVPDAMEEGDYPLYIKNVVMSTEDIECIKTPDIKSTITINDYQLGDVNCNGVVDVIDIAHTANYILYGQTLGLNMSAADCNEDGEINITDIALIASYILNGSPEYYNKYIAKLIILDGE